MKKILVTFVLLAMASALVGCPAGSTTVNVTPTQTQTGGTNAGGGSGTTTSSNGTNS